MIKEINVICVNKKYRFTTDEIAYWDFDFKPDVFKITFKDGSFIEFYIQNIVCVEYNTEEAIKDKGDR